MATAIGVLCARVRVEEKQVIAALERAGVVAMPIPPASMPLPVGPTLQDVQHLTADIPGCEGCTPLVMIDRIANRAIGRSINRLIRSAGVSIVDAGVASRRNRLQVATVWQKAGVSRPKSLAAFSEATAMSAANQLGYPATMFPMLHSNPPASLPDADTADAVIEHRVVLGTPEEEIVMLQAGALLHGTEWYRIHVAGFKAVAASGPVPDAETFPPDEACALAEQASRVLDAGSIAIDITRIEGEWVVWDAVPIADFRKATQLGATSVADAIAAHAIRIMTRREQEVRDVVLAN